MMVFMVKHVKWPGKLSRGRDLPKRMKLKSNTQMPATPPVGFGDLILPFKPFWFFVIIWATGGEVRPTFPRVRQRLNCHGLQEITQYSRTTNKLKQQPFS
jgi:hypothetical protein